MKKITTLLFVAIGLCLTSSAFASARVSYVRCESIHERPRECFVGLRRVEYVRIVRQHSSSPCIQGSSYGVTRYQDAIWVARGCRGDFEVRGW